jgi:hypothetical protein
MALHQIQRTMHVWLTFLACAEARDFIKKYKARFMGRGFSSKEGAYIELPTEKEEELPSVSERAETEEESPPAPRQLSLLIPLIL